MTELENLMHVIKRTGKAEWVPISTDSLQFTVCTPDRDRPVGEAKGLDWFGCCWLYDQPTNGYVQSPYVPLPLNDITRWREQVKFPDLDSIDWEGGALKDLEGFNRESRALFIKTESGTFERLHQLRGFENAFTDMYEEPEAFAELMDAIANFRVRLYDKIAKYYKPDLIMVMDDLGSNQGPLLSPGMYRELIKPYDKKVLDSIHAHGISIVYHSCGCMQAFVGDLIEIGADMIHPLQGGINDQQKIENDYGDQVGFVNCLDNLVHLPGTSDQELRHEMRRVMDLFWKKKNIIVMPTSYAHGNGDILLDEARKFNEELKARI